MALEIGGFVVALFLTVALPLAIRANVIVLHGKINKQMQLIFFLSCFVIWLSLIVLSTSYGPTIIQMPQSTRWIARVFLLLWTLFGIAGLPSVLSWMDKKSDQEDSRRGRQKDSGSE
jgi:hypothetical protein